MSPDDAIARAEAILTSDKLDDHTNPQTVLAASTRAQALIQFASTVVLRRKYVNTSEDIFWTADYSFPPIKES